MATKLKLGTDNNWATKVDKLLAYNDENGNFKPIEFDADRDSTSTRVNKSGLVENVEANRPRVQFDNNDGYLLLEPARTNLQIRSEEFDNAAWSKARITVTDDNTTSPDGSLSGSKLAENTSGTNPYFIDDLYGASGGTYTFSCFLKKGTLRYAGIRALTNNFGNRHFVLLDLDNGSVASTNTLGSGVSWEYKVDNYGDGWYRLSITGSHTSSNVGILISGSNVSNPTYGGAIPNYNADGNGNFYAWGAQVEAGTYPTSYIPTTSGAVTRTVDYASGAGNSDTFNDSEGTLFIDAAALGNDGTYRVLNISDGTLSNRVLIQLGNNNNQIRVDLVSSGVTQTSLSTTSYTFTDFNKIAFKYKGDDTALFINGTQVGTTQTGKTMPTGLDRIDFTNGNLGNTFYFRAKLKQLMYFNEALSDSELIALTS